MRYIHAVEVPFSGPSSYDTFSPSLSLYPNTLAYYTQKKWQQAKDRGEFVDIHDFTGMKTEDFDVLITDLNHQKLESDLSEILGVPYLSKVTEADAKKVDTARASE